MDHPDVEELAAAQRASERSRSAQAVARQEAEKIVLGASHCGRPDHVLCLSQVKQLTDALARALTDARRAEQEESAKILMALSLWIRQPGNIFVDDAIDECARLLENNAYAIRQRAAAEEGANK